MMRSLLVAKDEDYGNVLKTYFFLFVGAFIAIK